MIEIRNRWLTLCNSVLSFVLTMLGISSCDLESADEYGPMVLEYGSPYAEYEVSGTITDEEGNPVQNENVIVRQFSPSYEDETGVHQQVLSDTVKSNAEGKYHYQRHDYPYFMQQKIRIVADDPTGVYENDSVDVLPEKVQEGEGTWNNGKYAANHDFKLKKK